MGLGEERFPKGCGHEPVEHFVHGAVAADNDYDLPVGAGRLGSELDGIARLCGAGCLHAAALLPKDLLDSLGHDFTVPSSRSGVGDQEERGRWVGDQRRRTVPLRLDSHPLEERQNDTGFDSRR